MKEDGRGAAITLGGRLICRSGRWCWPVVGGSHLDSHKTPAEMLSGAERVFAEWDPCRPGLVRSFTQKLFAGHLPVLCQALIQTDRVLPLGE